MGRARWITALGMLAAGVLGVIAAAPIRAATPQPQLCIVGCTTTTAAAPTSTTPIPGPVTVSDVTYTSARFTGEIGTGGESVPYQWALRTSPTPNGYGVGGNYEVGSEPNPAPVSWTDSELTPNSTYYVQLSTDGGQQIGPLTSFRTPVRPAVAISVSSRRRSVTIGEFTFDFRLASADPGAPWVLQGALAPFRHWNNVVDPATGQPDTGSVAEDRTVSVETEAVRNEHFRIRLPGTESAVDSHQVQRASTSAVVPVIVYPQTSELTSRPDDNATLEATYQAIVHSLPSHQLGERVYFYTGPGRDGPFRLVGSARLKRFGVAIRGEQTLVANLTFDEPAAVGVFACIRRPIVPDMGTPFLQSFCGKPYLPKEG